MTIGCQIRILNKDLQVDRFAVSRSFDDILDLVSADVDGEIKKFTISLPIDFEVRFEDLIAYLEYEEDTGHEDDDEDIIYDVYEDEVYYDVDAYGALRIEADFKFEDNELSSIQIDPQSLTIHQLYYSIEVVQSYFDSADFYDKEEILSLNRLASMIKTNETVIENIRTLFRELVFALEFIEV